MLPSVKVDLQLNNNEDLEYFKMLFLRNVGVEQMSYYFNAFGIQVRLQVSSTEGLQRIDVGLFHFYNYDEKSITIEQFCPLSDGRFTGFETIQNYWVFDPRLAWASIVHTFEDAEIAYNRISEILDIVRKVYNLEIIFVNEINRKTDL